ncbi:DUF6600 domain-containing protein [Legionella waltersii]|uniref:Uncharacterized protein n=1 Tax=Legionella waltersii TaxID=66969 RepID=A0A0W1ALL6_9GAMM|nr:DUF6600 domain-containing protein [Legionella waltersii]KTD82209.1 hypothetical protein Lwal_0686 [Legionella waltersii]SNV10732.1 Uncharacterised protein [Legionella waltersii]
MKSLAGKTCTLFYVLFSLPLIVTSSIASADPSTRVARISLISGVVSYLPASETKWIKTNLNRPLVLGDSLWSDTDSKVELQLGLATTRLGSRTSVQILNLNNQIAQFKLSDGTFALNVVQLKPNQVYEIDTPNLAVIIKKNGYYRIDVNNASTTVTVRKGQTDVYGEKSAYTINQGQTCQFKGTKLQGYQCSAVGPIDGFDRWSMDRDQPQKINKPRYVNTAVIGYEDLDTHGTWRKVKKYGYVWSPNNVGNNWAPYRTGQWVWVRHWGWTWVDEQPWGFAPFHYGRWIFIERRWAWIPGPIEAEPMYAPALVAFVGGRNYQLSVANRPSIAWFPLGPGDIYIPPYQVSRNYFQQINVNNTVINNTYVTTVYNNQNTTLNYQNVTVQQGITAVPLNTFVQSQPVNNAQVQVSDEIIVKAPKTPTATITPDQSSFLGGQQAAESKPAAEIMTKPTVVITEPPTPQVPFTEEQKLLEKNPGKPLTSEEVKEIQVTKPEEQEQLKLVDPQTIPQPVEIKSNEQPSTEQKPDVQQQIHEQKPSEEQPQNQEQQQPVEQPQNQDQQQQPVEQKEQQPVEQQPQIQEQQPVEQQPQIQEQQPVEQQPQIQEQQPVEQQPQIQEQQPVEQQPQTQEQQPVEQQPQTQEQQPVEQPPQIQEQQPVEQPPQIQEQQPVEQQPQIQEQQPVEQPPQIQEQQPVEQPPQIQEPQPVEQQPQIQEQQPVEQPPQIQQQQPNDQQQNQPQ